MKILTIIILIITLTSCANNESKKDNNQVDKIEQSHDSIRNNGQSTTKKSNAETIENLQTNNKSNILPKIPDTLEWSEEQLLTGDFNGDGQLDYAGLIKNKTNQQTGVIIINDTTDNQYYIFGAGQIVVRDMTDLKWIDIFETLPKGDTIAPTIVDKETGDIIGPDKSKSFVLTGNGIYLGVSESSGGGIIFWNRNDYEWYHIE